jgi:hypothetical protein
MFTGCKPLIIKAAFLVLCSSGFAAAPSAVDTLLAGKPWLVEAQTSAPAARSVLVFLSPICPCSRYHEKQLAQMKSEFPDTRFVAVYSGNDAVSEDEARNHFKNLGFGVVRDTDFALADRFGALRTPHAFVLDAAGEIQYQGAVDDKRSSEPTERYLQKALFTLAKGQPADPAVTAPMGCRIAR